MGRKLTTRANWHSVLQAHHLLRRLEAWTTMLHSLLLHLLHMLQLLLSQYYCCRLSRSAADQSLCCC